VARDRSRAGREERKPLAVGRPDWVGDAAWGGARRSDDFVVFRVGDVDDVQSAASACAEDECEVFAIGGKGDAGGGDGAGGCLGGYGGEDDAEGEAKGSTEERLSHGTRLAWAWAETGGLGGGPGALRTVTSSTGGECIRPIHDGKAVMDGVPGLFAGSLGRICTDILDRGIGS
jgi:hypothetical protein